MLVLLEKMNKIKKKAIIVSGYFNPIHKGHIEYFNNAKKLANELFVIVNSDYQRSLKGSKKFQEEDERMIIVSNIKAVDKAILSIDKDRTVCQTLQQIFNNFGFKYELFFARDPGFSKSGADLKVTIPLESTLNLLASGPP